MKKTFENWLVVSDVDGTLNSKFRKLPHRNYNAIKEFTDRGGNFTLASGRLVSSLQRNYNKITANQPAVALNGAGIY
ncbi:MAG: HAD hydrolase family protein, partial [Clostridiales bacterium]|nr:HAD hydrolase family protein [Clostridiales bacterium]